MKQIKIDLLDIHNKQQNHTIETVNQLVFPKYLMLLFSIAFILTGTTVLSYQQSQNATSPLSKTWSSFLNFAPVQTLTTGTERTLAGEQDGRINVLLLGIGGPLHDGPYLSDTIIIASLKPSTHDLALISIPRDLVVNIPSHGWRKINEINSFGEVAQAGGGAEFTRTTLSTLFNIPIQYAVRIDFSGFEKIVDILGGLDITVDKSFTDYSYPAPNYKYRVVSFKEGPQVMDGTTALQFVRSRHSANNQEGSDFARSKRQQKVIVALKNKLLSISFLSNPQKISSVIRELQDSIATNIQGWELMRLSLFARQIDEQKILSTSIDGASGLVYDDIVEGAYVLRPSDGTYEAIKQRIANVFEPGALEPLPPAQHPPSQFLAKKKQLDQKALPAQQPEPIEQQPQSEQPLAEIPADTQPQDTQEPLQQEPQDDAESATITLRNGTTTEGLASQNAALLKALGFSIDAIANAPTRGIEKTILIDLSKGAKPQHLHQLLRTYNPTLNISPSQEMIGSSQSDFILILGLDAVKRKASAEKDQQPQTAPAPL
ncbi:MAG: LCP family protein [Patescibacteria group bacterium]